MPHLPEDQNTPIPKGTSRCIDCEVIEFPSDALSVKRLRQIYPRLFDSGMLTDNLYGGFFVPLGDEDPPHLMQLHELLSAERVLAEYAFCNAIDPYPSETLDEELHGYAVAAREQLEQLYQQFRLADSPATARLLVRQVEEEGARQADGRDRAR
jgi:hypothetical protein